MLSEADLRDREWRAILDEGKMFFVRAQTHDALKGTIELLMVELRITQAQAAITDVDRDVQKGQLASRTAPAESLTAQIDSRKAQCDTQATAISQLGQLV